MEIRESRVIDSILISRRSRSGKAATRGVHRKEKESNWKSEESCIRAARLYSVRFQRRFAIRRSFLSSIGER